MNIEDTWLSKLVIKDVTLMAKAPVISLKIHG